MQDSTAVEPTAASRPAVGEMNVTRRRAMRIMAGATGAAAVGMGADRAGLQPVGEADAIAPAIVYAGYAAAGAGAVAIGWALREYEVIGADDPPEGLTADALKNQVYEAARKRRSDTKSTIIDNQNILQGFENNLWIEGKLAAIEALNSEKSQSDVQAAGIDAVNGHAFTIQNNFRKSWNEALNELENLKTSLDDHPDTTHRDVLVIQHEPKESFTSDDNEVIYANPHSVELADGETYDFRALTHNEDDAQYSWSPTQHEYGNNPVVAVNGEVGGGDYFTYLEYDTWAPVWTEMETKINNVRDGLVTWVDSVYSQVQSGDIAIEDLITPRERAAMMSDDEDYPQAIADLIALNIPVDLEREATIEIPSKNATLVGTIGVTDESQAMETGTTYSPSDFGSVYFTYDVSKGEGDWSEYQTGVDGGTVTFTAEPYADTTFRIHTTAGEQADVTAEDFTDQGDGTWTVDISGQVETAITEIDSVDFFADVDATQYETVQLQDDFTVTKFEDSDGNEHDSADFTSSEPQDDTNYITQEEWEQLEQQNQELIEKYEEAIDDGGGGWLDFGGGSGAGLVLVAAAALGAILLGNNN